MAVEGLVKYKKANEVPFAENPKVEYKKTNSSFILYILNGQRAERTLQLHIIFIGMVCRTLIVGIADEKRRFKIK
jgi:hypothetical protein